MILRPSQQIEGTKLIQAPSQIWTGKNPCSGVLARHPASITQSICWQASTPNVQISLCWGSNHTAATSNLDEDTVLYNTLYRYSKPERITKGKRIWSQYPVGKLQCLEDFGSMGVQRLVYQVCRVPPLSSILFQKLVNRSLNLPARSFFLSYRKNMKELYGLTKTVWKRLKA